MYGNGDFAESLKLAFNLGWDADCNAATVGTIVGVIYGYKKMLNPNDHYAQKWNIVDRYKNTTRENMPMDETITSFADRLVDLFELINEKNGGSKVVSNNKVVYRIPFEKPAPVRQLISADEQKRLLFREFEEDITGQIANGVGKGLARAAYLAVCLDMAPTLSKKYPRQ